MDQSKHNQNVVIPWEELEVESLRNLVQSYIETEDATYHGVLPEMTIDEKIDVVIEQLRSGTAEIHWNTYLESGTIVLKKDAKSDSS
jgi:uncharacterized protein YheU (UPF0270 family)